MKLKKYEWFNSGYEDHSPDRNSLVRLRELLVGTEIHIVIDVDCFDVQVLIPPFIRVLVECDFTQYKIFYVNKTTLPFMSVEAQAFISKVPTIIVKKNKKIIATIIERLPRKKSIEQEMEALLNFNNR